MEYTVNKLAKLSGVSTRTLRYYDEIGLLKPARVSSNGYRIYGQQQIDLLQQILFYRQLGVPLNSISEIINSPDFDREKALEEHLSTLQKQQLQIEALIANVQNTILAVKGERLMSNQEKFEVFKENLIRENQEKYGEELAEKYSQEEIDSSNAKLAGMTSDQWQQQEELTRTIFSLLKSGMESGDPAGADAMKACEAHKQWLNMFWKDGKYSPEAHRNLAQMYLQDERFTAYYEDGAGKGAAEFLCRALEIYTKV